MQRVLLTAFGAYDDWQENASWLALQSLTRTLPDGVDVTTRLYPVDFAVARERIESDLRKPYDVALHTGQAPGAAAIRLEAIALNTMSDRGQPTDAQRPLEADGPIAYRSRLPLADWASLLQGEGIPAEVSLHAGDYLCNAALYWSHFFAEQAGIAARAAFVHVPLDLAQAARQTKPTAAMPCEVSGYALRLILQQIAALPDKPTGATLAETTNEGIA